MSLTNGTVNVAAATPALGDLSAYIACPHCDALYRTTRASAGEVSRCARCHAVLMAPRAKAGMTIIMLCITLIVLVGGALWFPFLTISRSGFGNSATLVDVARAFSDGWQVLLALSVLGFIVLIPLARAFLLIYVLTPIVFDRLPAHFAATAFRVSERMRPWSMAEIFALGGAVSLVKVADLAIIGFGPAFWMFCAVVVIQIILDMRLCRWSVWEAIADGHENRAAGAAA